MTTSMAAPASRARARGVPESVEAEPRRGSAKRPYVLALSVCVVLLGRVVIWSASPAFSRSAW